MAKLTHILVIRLSAMGDVAMTVPVLHIFRKTYPQVKIAVLSRPFFKPLFNGISNLDFLEADVYGEHKGMGLLKLGGKAQGLGIDAVADLHNVLRSKIITTFLKFKGLKTATIDKGRAEKKALINAKGKDISPVITTHKRYAKVFEDLGYPLDLNQYAPPEAIDLSPKIRSLMGVEPKKIVGIAPFAAHAGKMYPLKMMSKVIAQLDASDKYRIFLFGGGKEETELLKALENPFSNVSSVAGKLSFSEEISLISNLDIMVSMDSGNGHLAAIFGIPVITLWGVTHPYAGFSPFNQPEKNQLLADRSQYPLIPTSIYGNKFPEGYENAITTIAPEAIVLKIKENL